MQVEPTNFQIGFVLLATLLLFREMMFWITRIRNGKKNQSQLPLSRVEWETMAKENHDLHVWHRPEWADEPGVKVWYTDRLLRRTLEKNNELIHKQNILLDRILKRGGMET